MSVQTGEWAMVVLFWMALAQSAFLGVFCAAASGFVFLLDSEFFRRALPYLYVPFGLSVTGAVLIARSRSVAEPTPWTTAAGAIATLSPMVWMFAHYLIAWL